MKGFWVSSYCIIYYVERAVGMLVLEQVLGGRGEGEEVEGIEKGGGVGDGKKRTVLATDPFFRKNYVTLGGFFPSTWMHIHPVVGALRHYPLDSSVLELFWRRRGFRYPTSRPLSISSRQSLFSSFIRRSQLDSQNSAPVALLRVELQGGLDGLGQFLDF